MLLTAGVLVTVISFAISVRLTAQGKLGPLETIKYMFLVMPAMLQFALPFAAAFGATLSYHRMSQDNELTAAAASGVSHKMLLVPALVSGLVLAGIMSLLLDQVVPRMFVQMEQVVAQDAARMVVGPIEAGQPLEMGGTLVHADSVRRLGPNPEHDAFETLLLTGVFALDLDEKGTIRREAAAGKAVIEFSYQSENAGGPEPGPVGQATQLAMRLNNASVFSAEDGVAPTGGALTMYATLPSSFDDNPKFRTTPELKKLPEHPDNLRFIDVLRRDVAFHIAEREATNTIAASLKSKGAVRLKDEAGRTLTIRAAGLEQRTNRWELLPPKGGLIEVDLSSGEGSDVGTRHLSAHTAGIRGHIGKDRAARKLTVRLDLERVAGRIKAGDPAGERESQVFPHLSLDENPLDELLRLPTPQLLAEVDRRDKARGPDSFVAAPANELRRVLREVGREIVSKYHERWASCVSALVMVLAGALTAMRLGSSLPLAVYLWCFFPALFTVITIAMGQQVAHKVGLAGLSVLWGGVGGLAAYTAAAFAVVRRH